jgi:hypothetical protein
MNVQDLLQPVYVKPAAVCGTVALLTFGLAWWLRDGTRRGFLLAAAALSWIACHVLVNTMSYLWPVRQGIDWFVFASGMLVIVTLIGSWKRMSGGVMTGVAGVLALAAFWLAMRQMPYLLERGEPSFQRLWLSFAGAAGVACAFASAEWIARRTSPAAILAGQALFALGLSLGLFRMGSGERLVALPLATGAAAAGAFVAAVIFRRRAGDMAGAAGWMAAGLVTLFLWGCLSRATQVPVVPMAAVLVIYPAAALAAAAFGRLFLGGRGLAAAGVLFAAGAGILALCPPSEPPSAPLPSAAPAATGADDTGAYD